MLYETAQNAKLIESWKDGKFRDDAIAQCHEFLQRND